MKLTTNVTELNPAHEEEILRLCHAAADLSLNLRVHAPELRKVLAEAQRLMGGKT